MEPYLGYGYLKMFRKRKKTHVAYRAKMEKESKLLKTITICSKLRFLKMNSQWKGLR
jgi:hypothetical protein